MPDLSVIIPSRKEKWLAKTVESIRTAIRGDTEIIVVIDGEEDGPPVADCAETPRVRILRNATPLGQRQACNQGVRASEAKFILKTDAHSLMDEGFDVKLTADCERDWTVIPTMWNLHSHDMVCTHCGERFYNLPELEKCPKCQSVKISGKPAMVREVLWQPNRKKSPTNWMWFRSPDCAEMPLRVQYWDGPAAREFPAEYAAFKGWAKRQPPIADVMTGQGACWCMHRDRYWELGGLDEAHGGWGQMGVEIAMKSWLSGGRQVVNRQTWFAHLFRCGGSEGCPWEMDGREQEAARQYSIKLWTSGTWPLQKRPLAWLIEKFWPVPTWKKPETVPELRDYTLPGATPKEATTKATKSTKADLTVLYYTDDSLPSEFAWEVAGQLIKAKAGLPCMERHQPKDWPRSHKSIYQNILAGLENVTTPFVALAEHDVLYPEGYFDHRPKADIDYNINRWCLHADRGIYSRRREWAMSGLFARTEVLKANIEARLKLAGTEQWAEVTANFEPGKGESAMGIPEVRIHRFKAKYPTVDITGHGFNLTGSKRPRTHLCDEIPYWGKAADVLQRFHVPRPENTKSEIRNPKSDVAIHMTGDPTIFEEGLRKAEQQLDSLRQATFPTLSVLIPARNEEYLQQTIDDLCKNLRLDFEILVGLDGYQPVPPLFPNPRVRVIHEQDPIGMRPMINKLARAARGEYLMRMDAHCMVAPGIDEALVGVCRREGHVGVVAMRYELNPRHWERREKTDVPYRRLSHVSEDGVGLRSLPWPEFGKGREGIEVDETMTCSGSSWTCRRDTFVDVWGGFDERHGTFGQEGCEIACMFWLSGGRFLVHKGTWYAHWNRGKSTYPLGPSQKPQSIKHSHELWVGNAWPHARVGFGWLLEKFNPPGWESEISNLQSSGGIPGIRQRALLKTRKRLRTEELWRERDSIADPGKRHRLTIFWRAYEEFVRSVLAGNARPYDTHGQYYRYLVSHLERAVVLKPSAAQLKKVDKSIKGSLALIESVKANGLKAPLEFYQEDGRLVLWKGYRRLVIARVLGIPRIVARVFADRRAAGALSPQANLTRLQDPPVTVLHDLAAEQFRRWGNGATDKYFTHGYTRYYDMHLHAIRKRTKKVLELGLLNGASLALWRDYFPRAHIVGVDINPERWQKFAGKLPNSEILIGDETNAAFVQQVAAKGPYDLIVDDASHDPALQRQAFEWLWPAVRQYGFYVIEDTFRSYDGGEPDRGTCLPAGLEARLYRERDILAIHHYYNITLIQKGT